MLLLILFLQLQLILVNSFSRINYINKEDNKQREDIELTFYTNLNNCSNKYNFINKINYSITYGCKCNNDLICFKEIISSNRINNELTIINKINKHKIRFNYDNCDINNNCFRCKIDTIDDSLIFNTNTNTNNNTNTNTNIENIYTNIESIDTNTNNYIYVSYSIDYVNCPAIIDVIITIFFFSLMASLFFNYLVYSIVSEHSSLRKNTCGSCKKNNRNNETNNINTDNTDNSNITEETVLLN